MKVPRFLKDKWFYISVAVIILLIIIGFEVTFRWLDSYTRHGEEMLVPDLVGKNYEQVKEDYSDIFNFQLIDSVYVKNFPEGAVYQQNPKPGMKMKKGRNLYIIRTSVAPEVVSMPNLRNLSLRQAMVSLNSVGLKVEKLEFVDHFARNAVVEQLVSGNVIEPNSDIVKGTSVTLKVGLGRGDKTTNLPDLIGVMKENTKERIINASLNLGAEIYIDNDEPENLFVFKMEPEYDLSTVVTLGSDINVWYRSTKTFDLEWYNYEKFRRDSVVNALTIAKKDPEMIKYVKDSFNYILSHRTFSFDSLQRISDMNMIYERPRIFEIDSSYFLDSTYFDDNELDNNYFYDE